jgi:pimeloyl-ACP methyl ester carboxylesterase
VRRIRITMALTVTVAVLSTLVGSVAQAAPASRLHWGPCAEMPDDPNLSCATIPVPVDWKHPNGPTIDLAVARRTATDPAARIGSLLINPGGPGGSGRGFAIFGADFFSPRLRGHFDLIGFDPRGVGQSHPVLCSTELLLRQPHFLMTDQAEFDAMVAYNKAVRKDCRKHTGPVFDHLDMINVVHDVDALRAALGEKKLTYYGVSYGSLDAQQYAERFPDRIRAVVADSNMDHSLGARGFLDTEAVSAQDAFDEFVAWCDRTAGCALHGRDVRAVWQGLLARTDRGEIPHPLEPTRPLRSDELIDFAFGGFYGPEWAFLAEILALLDADEPLPIEPQPPDPPLPDLVENPGLAIFCNDWSLPVRDYREFATHVRRSAALAPDMRFSSAALPITVGCLGSPSRVANPQHELNVRGAATPLLLVNALHDPATGYNWGANAARQLGREAVLLTYDGWGHAVYGRSPCVTDAVDDYLISQTLPARGAHCPGVEPPQVTTTRSTRAFDPAGQRFPY